MADSQAFRKKFYVGNLVFLAICTVIVLFVFLLRDAIGSKKADWTKDKVYTISDATKTILRDLIDKVQVDYYASAVLPSHLENLKRDTRDYFEEFREISGGTFDYAIIDPEAAAEREAERLVKEYFAARERGETPEEPEPVKSIEQIFMQQQGPSQEDIRKQREDHAKAVASQGGRDKDEIYRELLFADYKRNALDKLKEEGIRSFPVQERDASSFRQVNIYSSIAVRYLDKPQEVIPVHFNIESLEYELASRILKLTQEEKPVVLFFDAARPDVPPNPMNPADMPHGDYEAVENGLRELFDVRTTRLKDGDAIEDAVRTVKEAAERKRMEKAGEEIPDDFEVAVEPADYAKHVKCLIVAQPNNLEARQVYEINKAASLGIKVIVAASPYSIDVSRQGVQQGLPIATLSPGREFQDMLREWGVEPGSEILASNPPYCGPVPVLARLPGFGAVMTQQPGPVAVAAAEKQINQTDPLTNRIPQLYFPGTAGLTVRTNDVEKAGLKAEILATTSPHTWSHPIDPFKRLQNPLRRNQGMGTSVMENQEALLEFKHPETFSDFLDDPATLAVRLIGKVPFTFEGETIPDWKPEPEPDEDGAAGGPPGFPGFPGGFPGDGRLTPNPVDPQDAAEAGDTADGSGDAAPADTAPAEDAPETGPAEDAAVADDAPETDTAEDAAAATTPAPDGDDAGADGEDDNVDVDAAEEAPKPPEKAHVEPVAGEVLLLASADMFKNDYLQLGDRDYLVNWNFLRNAVETYGLSTLLLEIRRKQLTVPYFEPGSDKLSNWIIALNLAFVPLLVVGAGVVIFVVRRMRSVSYERAFVEGKAQ